MGAGGNADFGRVLPRARLVSSDQRFSSLVDAVLSRFPRNVDPIMSVSRIEMKRRGNMEGLVGLTTYCCVTAEGKRVAGELATQKITFYSELLDQISDDSAVGVIAHELAHAWLNEYASPEDSKEREEEADELARRWGYGVYLDALASETEAS